MSHAAIDTDDLPGEKIRQVGGEKFNDPGAVFRCAETSHRDMGHEFVLDLAETAHPVHRGHIARRNGIDVHAVGRQFQGEGTRQLNNAGLGRGIGSQDGHERAEPGD